MYSDIIWVATQMICRKWQISDTDLVTALIMAVYLRSWSELDATGKIWLGVGAVSRFNLDGLRHQRKTRRKGRNGSCK